MCGICGIVDLTEPPRLAVLLRMIGQLRHRGPDGQGYFRDERCALGHTRLAIIDVAGGAQPMASADGTLWVTFNGEIFNYLELAEELRRAGHVFRTASDTEVILHAWRQWGTGCFARFNGQWALALWDRDERRLVLSRDRLGVRPLYYTRFGTPGRVSLRFASEVKALFADPAVPRGFDPLGLHETFTYWSTVAPRTVYSGIEQLEPGHYAMFDQTGWRKAPYWRVEFPEPREFPADPRALVGPRSAPPIEALRETLIEAARLRFLRSDVPVGAYLSGGLDSSIIAAVVHRYANGPLHTFSLRFSSDEFDEGRYQKIMAASLGTRHEEIMVGPSDIAGIFPEVIRHTETPILRAAPAPLYLLSRLVAGSGYKVVVTGEGADEVFGGYDLFREARVRRFWARDPDSARRARAAELLYPWLARSPGRLPGFARSFFGRHLDLADPALSHRPRWDSTAAIKSMLTPELRAAAAPDAIACDAVACDAAGADVAAGLLAAMPPEAAGWDPLGRAQWLEMTTLLAGYILASQGDRMLMANSVEGRFPFLDRDVVDFAAGMPAGYKLLGLEEKYLLKRAFADLVPAEIRQRPKQPYRAPDAECFFAPGTPDWFFDLTSPAALRAAGVFEPAMVASLLAKGARTGGARMSNTDNMRILAIISTQLTHATFVAGDAVGGDAAAGGGGREASRPDPPAPPAPAVAVDLGGSR